MFSPISLTKNKILDLSTLAVMKDGELRQKSEARKEPISVAGEKVVAENKGGKTYLRLNQENLHLNE